MAEDKVRTAWKHAEASRNVWPRSQSCGNKLVYVSNFGEHTIVPSRFNRDKTVQILDFDYWAVAYLRPFKVEEIAKTGDAEKRMMLVSATLVSRNEAASGKVTSLTTS